MSGFVGSIAISETPKFGNKSVLLLQFSPPSVDFQSPPLGEPTQIILGLVGLNSTILILPTPLLLPLFW